jgi:CDP-6-deoxy-D-xylo-4-hexulose-3-dehydrase
MQTSEELKDQILELVKQYYAVEHARKPFEPGKTRVCYSGRVYDEQELVNLVSSSLDFWLTAGPLAEKFERGMRDFFRSRDFVLVNSGSSANLLMVAVLRSRQLTKLLRQGDLPPLEEDDEVITPAVTFPTTLAPLVQYHLTPVFVDCEEGTYNLNPDLVEDAVGPRTKAIFVPHTLGIPCDMARIMDVASRRNLWVLEDGCDALGATCDDRLVGTFGAMSSLSFYPAHHMTMGEGGGVVVNHPRLQRVARSIKDWGRDCWCDPGMSNTCGKRFEWELGDLPYGYDHKYVYSDIGFNLKATDLQAAIGLAQIQKKESFIAARRENFKRFLEGLKDLEEYLILPRQNPRFNPSPFGFPVTVREGVERSLLVRHLEEANIETRLPFGGNILRQPGFMHIPHRVHGCLEQSDIMMNRTMFVGVYPGLTAEMVQYVIDSFHGFFGRAQ